MKKHIARHLIAATFASSLALAELAPNLPHKIAIASEAKKTFRASDRIDIEEVTGTAPDFRVGETYRVKGVCRQTTLSNGELYLGNTSTGSNAITAAQGSTNHVKLAQGATSFDFIFTLHRPGRLHVTMYDLDNHSLTDNAYAGLFLGPVTGQAPDAAAGKKEGTPASGDSYHKANEAILAYLGQPVPPPAELDNKFSAKGLLAAFTGLCEKEGYPIKELMVDDREFPFLVFGRIAGKKDINGFTKELGPMEPYVYGGSVIGRTETGENFFSVNLTPSSNYPANAAQACRRRLMIRMEMLAAQVRK